MGVNFNKQYSSADTLILISHLCPAAAADHGNDQQGDHHPDRHHHDEEDPRLARPELLALVSQRVDTLQD